MSIANVHSMLGRRHSFTAVAICEGSTTSTEFTYNGDQELTQKVDEIGGTWTYTYDFWGQQLTVKDPNGNAANSANPTGMTYEYVYNGYGLLTDIYSPVNASSSKTHIVMEYDNERGLLTSRTDGKGQETCFTYDNLSRLTQIDYLCDTGGEYSVTYTYDKNNNRTQMVDVRSGTFATTTYEYFETNMLEFVTQPDGLYYEYHYDGIHHITTLRNPDGQTVSYEYDVNGRLEEITNPYDSSAKSRPHYDNAGRLRSMTYPAATRSVIRTL